LTRSTRDQNVADHAHQNVSSTARHRRKRLRIYRLIAATAVPLLVLLLLEAGLRLGGYGHESGFFIRAAGRSWLQTNPRAGWRYFAPRLARRPDPAWLADTKPPETFRIFILGGSAAMGVPDPAFSFGRVLRVMLAERYPAARFEVINAAMTAINSHVVRRIASDCAPLQPDLFVVYLGNNEVVGPYGPGTVFAGFSGNLTWIHASIWTRGTRLGQLVGHLACGLRPRARAATAWRGMEMFTGHRVAADNPRLETVYDHLRDNLQDICGIGTDAGADVLLCTVAVNLRDSPPFESMHRPDLGPGAQGRWQAACEEAALLENAGRFSEAIEHYRQALEIDGGHAELHYRLARCFEAAGDRASAKQHYVEARDLDALRFRADGRINKVIREVAARAGEGLVDAQRAFEAAAPLGIPGGELFYEHVHMTFRGNHVLAAAVLEKVDAILPERIRGGGHGAKVPADLETCARLLAWTDWSRYESAVTIDRAMDRPPFKAQLDHDETGARRKCALAAMTRTGIPLAMQEAAQAWSQLLDRKEQDIHARHKLANLEHDLGRFESSIRHRRVLLEKIEDPDFHGRLAAALAETDRSDEAMEHYERAQALWPYEAGLQNGMGLVAMRGGDFQGAEAYFTEAIRLDPLYVEAHLNLGDVFLKRAEPRRALTAFEEAAHADPRSAKAQLKLGIVFQTSDELDRAAEHYKKAIDLRGDFFEARMNLAAVLAQLGCHDEALTHLELAVRIRPDHGVAQHELALALKRSGDGRRAIEHYRRALAQRPDAPQILNDLAWILATHPTGSLRSGTEAVELAQKACAASGREPTPAFLDTLAAALAEVGRFDEAVQTITDAIDRARASDQHEVAKLLTGRIELFRAGRPYREARRTARRQTTGTKK
jgi:tetratricopeptide (TPR) repeat protein